MVHQADERLQRLLEPVVNMLGYELVGIEYFPTGHHYILRVYIDKEAGITLDDCEIVSRQVSALLDVEDPIRGQYTLEVSSPGLDRPLFTPEHFSRFSGKQVKLRLSTPLNGRRNYKGRLQGLDDGKVMLEVDGARVDLPLEDIEKARLVPEI
ncbi:MAG: ribosome maturation factor RimP [Gammaproteobacteria bacterium]